MYSKATRHARRDSPRVTPSLPAPAERNPTLASGLLPAPASRRTPGPLDLLGASPGPRSRHPGPRRPPLRATPLQRVASSALSSRPRAVLLQEGAFCGFSPLTPSSGTGPDPLLAATDRLYPASTSFWGVSSGLRRTPSMTRTERKPHVPVSALGISALRGSRNERAVSSGKCSFIT